jgi:hypothetical protein
MSGSKSYTKTGAGVLVDDILQSPVDQYQLRSRKKMVLLLLALLVILVGIYLVWRFTSDRPVDYSAIEEHFKYGSIGSEPGGSIITPVGGVLPPYWAFRVLPAVCPEQLPGGYASLGLLYEPGHDLPIGISRRKRLGTDMVGLNCAVCHTGTLRETPQSKPQIVLGMPAHQLDLQRFFRFVLDCTLDERFTADNVMGRIVEAGGSLGVIDRLLYSTVLIDRLRDMTLRLQRRIAVLLSDQVPAWGMGRVDTFNPYKAIQFNWRLQQLPASELIGAADFPSLWNQKPRVRMHLHWDGNNDSVDERNLSAALGAGVTPVTVDHARLKRVRDWIWTLPSPPYPYAINAALAAQGEALYAQHCRTCHDFAGALTGTVTPLEQIATDPYRLNSYTYIFATNQYTLYPDSPYRFTHFRKTNGYANQPLDGIWARAPYLHNGSVPTLRDLLEPPEHRPQVFYRGYDVFDQDKVGFVSHVPDEHGRTFFQFDTRLPGNGNGGHLYGTDLSAEQKKALVEYMKQL